MFWSRKRSEGVQRLSKKPGAQLCFLSHLPLTFAPGHAQWLQVPGAQLHSCKAFLDSHRGDGPGEAEAQG